MSWLSRIFGGNSGGEQAPAKPAAAAEIEHRGFTIRAEPYRSEGGQFQTAGTILKEIGGETRTHGFVRADRFATLDDAVAMSLQKGRQIVDEKGDKAFAQQSAKPV